MPSTSSTGWWDTDYLGIDQGPIVLMIENYPHARGVEPLHAEPDIQHGMQIATFTFDVLGATAGNPQLRLAQNTPNPFLRETTIRFSLAVPGHVHLALFDLAGRQVATLLDETRPAGDGEVRLDARDLPGGVYFYRLATPQGTSVRRCVVLR